MPHTKLETSSKPEIDRDVCVIGGGLGGLVSMKYLQEEGLSVVGLEQREDIGGIFNFSMRSDISTCLATTETNVSRSVMEFGDHPISWRGRWGRRNPFVHASEYINYLYSYCKKHSLIEKYYFNALINNVEKEGDNWRVSFSSKSNGSDNSYTLLVRKLIVATGIHTKENFIQDNTELAGFTGPIIHGHEFKKTGPEFYKKTVLIMGSAETAADIANDLSFPCSKVIMYDGNCTHHFAPKFIVNALDSVPRYVRYSHGDNGYGGHQQAMYSVFFPLFGKLAGDQNDGLDRYGLIHGVPIPGYRLEGDPVFETRLVNKSSYFMEGVGNGDILLRSKISGIEGNRVSFNDNDDTHEIDYAVMCRGFKNPYRVYNMYKNIFSPEDASVAFIGFVRPIIGGIPMIAETQARYVAKVFSGKVDLPSYDDMVSTINFDRSRHERIHNNAHSRIVIQDNINYCDEVASLAGCYPDVKTLWKTFPRSLLATQHSAFYDLSNPKKGKRALTILKRHPVLLTPLIPVLVILNRLLPRLVYFLSPYLYDKYQYHDSLSLLQITRKNESFEDNSTKPRFRLLYGGLSAVMTGWTLASGGFAWTLIAGAILLQHVLYNLKPPKSDFRITYKYEAYGILQELQALINDPDKQKISETEMRQVRTKAADASDERQSAQR